MASPTHAPTQSKGSSVASVQRGVEPRPCATCGVEFQPYRSYQVACSRACRERLSEDQRPPRVTVSFTCRDCGQVATAQRSGLGGGKHFYCPDCRPAADRRSQERKNAARRLDTAANPDDRRRRNRANAVGKYGITVEDYDRMFDAQGGVCAICSRPASGGPTSASRLHIDHCHTTGKVRALLCSTCNLGVGYFADDPDRLIAAAAYLLRHETTKEEV